MDTAFKHNHYVPEWYQKEFVPQGQVDQELYYLHLKPRYEAAPNGKTYLLNPLRKLGHRFCFAEDDLYTTRIGGIESKDIEKYFFGEIDRKGRDAVKLYAGLEDHKDIRHEAFRDIVMYMSTQKLRTPKGLDWLKNQARTQDKDQILRLMLKLRGIYGAIWTESVWLIADADESTTKFIVSDHPITIYNRACGPKSQHCRDFNDPDILFQASHTIFPLNLNKVLILTNLSWVRNPYQKELNLRPNPSYFHPAIASLLDIQILRHFSEQEVREINFIIKSRAYNCIGAGKKEWLYPEKFVSKSDWNTYGKGYLLMPDPRSTNYHTEVMWGGGKSGYGALDPYGRTPIDTGYKKESDNKNEFRTFHEFQGEFARLFGPKRRGRSFNMMQLDPEKDSDDYHSYHLGLEGKGTKNKC